LKKIELDFTIFNKLKEKLSEFESSNSVLINLSLDIIKSILVTSESRIETYSKMLISDIEEDIKKNKPNPDYMKNLFQPIFSAEKIYRLCIKLNSKSPQSYDTSDQVGGTDTFSDVNMKEVKPNRIESDL